MRYQQILRLQLVMFFRLGVGNALRSSFVFTNRNLQHVARPLGNSLVYAPETRHTLLYSSTSSNTEMQNIGQSSMSTIMEGLNPSQVEAVAKPISAITRVLAGPGSGKTRVLTCRIAYLLEHDRNRILAVTFTRKAANEMKERVEKLLNQQQQQSAKDDVIYPPSNDDDIMYPPSNYDEYYDGGRVVQEPQNTIPKGLDRVTLGTFHSVCAKILRYNGDQLATLPSVVLDMTGQDVPINLDGGFAILDQSDQLRILKECLDEQEIDLKKAGIKPLVILNAIGQIKESFSQGMDPFKSKTKGKPIPKSLRLAKDVYGLYRSKLFTNNAVDFDDLIFLTRELLTEDTELRERLHKRWSHVLVDEFQDTSRSQMDLVKLLTSSSLFVVGDADQSIYSWRGAHVGSMSDFTTEFKDYCDNGVDTVYLKENYRSTSNIVKAAEKVISMNGNSNKSDAELRRSMKPKRGSGPSPRVIACKDERAEANFVVDNIQQMLMDGELKAHNTAAIIYRTNAQSRYLEEACVQKNLPYVIRGGAGGFYKRAEVKDCLCFLRWLHNGNDEGSMLRAIKTPSRGIGEVAVSEFRDYYDEVTSYYRENFPEKKGLTQLDVLISLTDEESNAPSLLERGAPEPSVFISKRALNKFLPFSRQIRDIRSKANSLSVDALLFYIIDTLDLVSHFDTISKSKSEFADRRQNVQELRNAAKRYSTYGPALKVPEQQDTMDDFDNDSALGNFLDDVALVADITGDDDEASGESRFVVNLMTIHGSKGTEYDTVFVVGNEEGTLPTNLALQEGEGSVALEEEKRLCYVAMTRAKTRLIMTWRKEVTSFSNWSDDGPRTSEKDRSRFLDALVSKKKGEGKEAGKSRTKDTDSLLRGQRRSYSTAGPRSKRMPRKQQQPKQTFSDRSYLSAGSNQGLAPKQVNPRTSRPIRKSSKPSRPYLSHGMEDDSPRLAKRATPQRSLRPLSSGESRTRARKESIPKPTLSSRKAPQSQPLRPVKNKIARNSNPNAQKMDSTWFFPVGSKVKHETFGKGKVLEPPRDAGGIELPVRVQFEDGTERHFCAKGSDITPDL